MRYTVTLHPAGSFLLHTESRYASAKTGWAAAAGSAAWTQDASGISRQLELDEQEVVLLDALVYSSFWLRPQAGAHIVFLGAYATAAPRGQSAAVSGGGGVRSGRILAATCDVPSPSSTARGNTAQAEKQAEAVTVAADSARHSESVYCCASGKEQHSGESPRGGSAASSRAEPASGAAPTHDASQHSSLPDRHSIREQPNQALAGAAGATGDRSSTDSSVAGNAAHARFEQDRRICAAATSVEILISLRGGRCITTVAVDPRTWRPYAVQQRRMGCSETTELRDWRLWEGLLWFPARMQSVARGEVVQDVTIEEAVVCGPGRAEAALAEPFRQPPRVMWPEGAARPVGRASSLRHAALLTCGTPPVVRRHNAAAQRMRLDEGLQDGCSVPRAGTMWQPRTPRVPTFRTAAGHLLVQPLINGRDVGWLLADTGASSMVVQPEVADALEMPVFGSFKVNAVGGHIDTRYRVAQSFQLGPLIMEECEPAARCSVARARLCECTC